MGPKVYFFFISGAKKGKIEASNADVVRIGRQHYCEIQLDPYQDIPASGNHAHVIREGDRYVLVDAGSTWGTWKNDQRVFGPTPLGTGDVITLGQDNGGRQGPQLRFYLEKDILRCPSCDGPVYKRHFSCPSCSNKYCLRCIDFRTKTCKPCGARAGGLAPAAGWGSPPGFPAGPSPLPPVPPIPPQRATKVMPTGGVPGLDDDYGEFGLDEPYCSICQAFVANPTFACPSCAETVCVSHQHGAVCQSCAGSAAAPVAGQGWGSDSEPELRVPGLFGPAQQGPPVPPPPREDPFPPIPTFPPGQIPPTERLKSEEEEGFRRTGLRTPPVEPPRRPAPPATPTTRRVEPPAPRKVESDEGFFEGEKLEARRPPSIPCDQCGDPLTARNFFVCEGCCARLCNKHQSNPGRCQQCASGSSMAAPRLPPTPPKLPDLPPRPAELPRPPARPPQDFLETADAPHSEESDPLSGVQFECPHCDAPLARTARTCPSCKRTL